MTLLEVGAEAPAFSRPDQSGATHTLAQCAGQWVVVYFYPKDDTPGCTVEACGFRDIMAAPPAGVVVYGVSPDHRSSHGRFAEKYQLNFPLLADEPGDDGTPRMCADYGVWQERTMYGKTYMGVVRTTYLIDPSGRVAQRWDRVNVDGHAQAVMAAVAQAS